MKNLMGVVWDWMDYHYNGLDQSMAEFCLFRKPDLNIVDAYRVMLKHGPRGMSPQDRVLEKNLIISTGIVAADSAAAHIFGKEPQKVDYIRIASALKKRLPSQIA